MLKFMEGKNIYYFLSVVLRFHFKRIFSPKAGTSPAFIFLSWIHIEFVTTFYTGLCIQKDCIKKKKPWAGFVGIFFIFRQAHLIFI